MDGQTRGMPQRDAPHIRAIVGVLRWGREQAEFIRQTLPKLIAPAARTGSKLVTILRELPLTELDLPTGHDHSFENAAGNVLNDKFYEVSSYFSMTQHFRPPGIVVISLGTWNDLSEEQQAVMMEEAAALQDYEIALTAEVGAAAVEELKAKGMAINEADVAAFRARMGPVYEDFIAAQGGDLLEMVQNIE